jgi:hypothetical protein
VIVVWLPLVNHRNAGFKYPTTSTDEFADMTVRTSDPWYGSTRSPAAADAYLRHVCAARSFIRYRQLVAGCGDSNGHRDSVVNGTALPDHLLMYLLP